MPVQNVMEIHPIQRYFSLDQRVYRPDQPQKSVLPNQLALITTSCSTHWSENVM